MTKVPDAARRQELAEFIRAHRERLTPAMFGFPGGARRRTPGLRREEVAQLSGFSTTWYTWIEQAREVSISPAALARLARVLRLSPPERGYLFDLAGKRDPSADPGPAPALPAALLASVQALTCPAYLLDRQWTALSWNRAAARLFVGWLDEDTGDAPDRNLLRYIFLHPAARRLIPDWESRARRVLAEFRVDYSHHLEDPGLQALTRDLAKRSKLFARAWDEHSVVGREGGARSFAHPQDGPVTYEQITLAPSSHPDCKLVMLVPDRLVPDGLVPGGPVPNPPAVPRQRRRTR